MRILGPIDWLSEVSGFCRCPGESMHTSQNGKKDCRVNLDGAPTVFCFHSSCIAAVNEANRQLRRELNASPWTLTLPGGRVLRSGDVLQHSGEIIGQTYRDHYDSAEIGPFFGWLCTEITFYPQSTLNLKTMAHYRTGGIRPRIVLEPSDHPLYIQQRDGITLDDAWRIVHHYVKEF